MKRKYTSNMPIEGFSKYHICKNGRLYSIHSGTWRLIKPVPKNTGYISNNLISDSGKRVNFYYVGKLKKKQYEEDFKRTHGMES